MGSSGGGGNTTSTVTQTNLPEYARPYFEDIMNKSQAIANQPYQPYTGQRIEGFNQSQQNAMNQINGMQQPWMLDRANDINNQASYGLANSGLDKYQSGDIGSTYNPNATKMYDAPDRVNSDFQAGEFNNDAAAKYMNPYQQQVTDIAKREAIRQRAMQGNTEDSAATKAGAFGGSRAALMKMEGDRNLQTALDDIQMKGSADAYNNAQQMFGADRAARLAQSQLGLGAQQFNSQQQMAYGNAGLQNQQFNEGQRMNAAQMGLQGQIANEQARQGAAGIRAGAFNNLANIGTMAANQGQLQQNMQLARLQAQMGVGNQQQALNQSIRDQGYQDFVNQRDWQKNNINWQSGILRGVPVTANSDTMVSQPNPNPLSQIAGLGIAGLGAYNAYNKG